MVFGLVRGRAHAQSAEAEALFNDGNKLMDARQFPQACEAFEASNRVEARAGALIRLGDCREQNQQLASAWSAYKDALTRVKNPQKRKVATENATALEPRLSYLTVSVPDDNRIDGLTLTRNDKSFDAILWNRALPVDGGDYVITARAPGHGEWQIIAHVPVERARVSVEVPKLEDSGTPILPAPPAPEPPPSSSPELPPNPSPESPPASVPTAEHDDREVVRSQGRFTTRRKIALGVASASAIAVIAGSVVGESARQKQNEAFKACPDPAMSCTQADQSNALLKSAHSRALEANVAFGVAAAGAIGAVVLWFTGAPDAESPRHVSVIPRVAPGETGIVIMGRF